MCEIRFSLVENWDGWFGERSGMGAERLTGESQSVSWASRVCERVRGVGGFRVSRWSDSVCVADEPNIFYFLFVLPLTKRQFFRPTKKKKETIFFLVTTMGQGEGRMAIVIYKSGDMLSPPSPFRNLPLISILITSPHSLFPWTFKSLWISMDLCKKNLKIQKKKKKRYILKNLKIK